MLWAVISFSFFLKWISRFTGFTFVGLDLLLLYMLNQETKKTLLLDMLNLRDLKDLIALYAQPKRPKWPVLLYMLNQRD